MIPEKTGTLLHPVGGQSQAAAVLRNNISQQAMILTYNDVFLIVGIFFAACMPFLLLFKTNKKPDSEESHATH